LYEIVKVVSGIMSNKPVTPSYGEGSLVVAMRGRKAEAKMDKKRKDERG